VNDRVKERGRGAGIKRDACKLFPRHKCCYGNKQTKSSKYEFAPQTKGKCNSQTCKVAKSQTLASCKLQV